MRNNLKERVDRLYQDLVTRERSEWEDYLSLWQDFRSIASAVGRQTVWDITLPERDKNTLKLCDVLLTEYLHELREEA